MNFSFLFIIFCSYININYALRDDNCDNSNNIKCKKGFEDRPTRRNADYDVTDFLTSAENNQYKIGVLSFNEAREMEGSNRDIKKWEKKIKKRMNRRRHQKRRKLSNKREEKLNKGTNSNLKSNQIQLPSIQPPTIQPPSIQPPTIQPPTIQPPSIQPPPKNTNLENQMKQNKFSEFYSDNEIKASLFSNNNNYVNLKKSFNLKENSNKNKEYVTVNFGNLPSNEVNLVLNQTEMKEFKHTFRKDGKKLKVRPPVDVKNAVVRTHNILRGKVFPPAQNMLAMSWSSAAAEQAQKWANQCFPGSETDHPSQRWTRTFGTCGQNVFVAFKKKRWSSVLRSWWNERRNFHYGYSENNITLVGKYTQMAWYNSHKVGCASAECANPNGKKFYRYVCNYCPTGNEPIKIHMPYSEGEQCGSCPNSCISVCRTKQCKLCTNNCPLSDLWNNCPSLYEHWKNWLCNTKTADGVMRFKNCRATCQCQNKIT